MLTILGFFVRVVDRILSRAWNFAIGLGRRRLRQGLLLGFEIQDGRVSRKKLFLPHIRRAEHMAVTGKTGTGKSFFLRSLIAQDLQLRHGIILFDVHGDLTPYLLQTVSALERKTGSDLSKKLIVIDPADAEYSCGLNVLEARGEENVYRLIAEFTHILQRRWGQEFGPRTLELLNNSLLVLSESNLTLLELAPLLSNAAFRAQCLKRITNNEVKAYFESRYNGASEAMQQAMSSPVLNKLTGFTVDPKFRHLLGQRQSTISVQEVLEKNLWLVVNLAKGRLGEQALTFGSLLFAKLKAAIFARRSRSLLAIYADEVQNLLASDASLEVLLSECRKFNVCLVTANQHFDQLPAQIRSAMAAIGTRIYFQLSPSGANEVSRLTSGGKSLADLLQNLPHRTFALKSGSQPLRRAAAVTLQPESADSADPYNRCRNRWARKRQQIEAEILERQPAVKKSFAEVSDAWE